MRNLKRYSPLMIVMYFIMLISLIFTSTFAWFSFLNEKKAYSDGLKIQEPPVLYILDCDTEVMARINLTGLAIGKKKQILFCVSNIFPVANNASGYNGNFSIQLCYTNNMKANFVLYPVDGVSLDKKDDYEEFYSQTYNNLIYSKVSENPLVENNVDKNETKKGNELAYGDNYSHSNNQATYKVFDYNQGKNSTLTYKENDDTTDRRFNKKFCRYFVLEVNWDGITDNIADISPKETDLIYVVARGSNNE